MKEIIAELLCHKISEINRYRCKHHSKNNIKIIFWNKKSRILLLFNFSQTFPCSILRCNSPDVLYASLCNTNGCTTYLQRESYDGTIRDAEQHRCYRDFLIIDRRDGF